MLFRCRAYKHERAAMAVKVEAQAPPKVVMAMRGVQRGDGGRTDEMVVIRWLMCDGGEVAGMEMLEDVMRKRKKLLGE